MKDQYAQHDWNTIVDIAGLKAFLSQASLPLLSYEEEKALAARIAGGDQAAKETLILHNLRWVITLATRYTRKTISIEDLVQEGVFGLIRAAEKYDGRARFSTYATWWIRQMIIRSIDELEQPIHLPNYQVEQIRRMANLATRLTTEHGREPTVDELAEGLHLSIKQIRFLQECSHRLVISLDMPATDDEQVYLRDLIEDPCTVEDAVDAMELSDEQKLFREALKTCTARERDIICRRYGIDLECEETLQEIAATYGMSRERIRQIEAKAMIKIARYIREHQTERQEAA